MLKRRSFLTLTAGGLLAACTPAAFAAHPAGDMWQRDLNVAWKKMQTTGRPMVLFITMDACYYCDKMLAETYANRAVVSDLNAGFVPAVAHSAEHPRLVARLGVESFPTTVIIGADSKVIDSIAGFVEADQFRRHLQAAQTHAATVQQVSHR